MAGGLSIATIMNDKPSGENNERMNKKYTFITSDTTNIITIRILSH